MIGSTAPRPAAIQWLAQRNLFVLSTNATTYSFAVGPKELVHACFGPRIPADDVPAIPPDAQGQQQTFQSEFPVAMGIQEVETSLAATFADGVRDLRLSYEGHDISGSELIVHLRDRTYALDVDLHYHVWPDYDLITRHISVHNRGSSPVQLVRVGSGSFPLPRYELGHYRLTSLAGSWGGETRIHQRLIQPGRLSLDSRGLITGHHSNPAVAVDVVDPSGNGAGEDFGSVWFAALEWSGNSKLVIEQLYTPMPVTRISAGLNDHDFMVTLSPGESFTSPRMILGYSDHGFGQVSRNLHSFTLKYLLPEKFRQTLRPVLYNSWEATFFDVTETNQIQLAEKAAALGVETFVVDDGWFGARDNDTAGLGDWTPSPRKFPRGLSKLIQRVNALGMQFGLWVEPEMTNPDSDLYRAHPDWIYRFPGREPTLGRNQLMLNYARPDVQEHFFQVLDRLLSENNIEYVKWDFNRGIAEPGWTGGPADRQQEVYLRHVEALYALVGRLRQRHPHVLFEACAGGGGRADFGALSRFDHAWTSDNTDPSLRLEIQQGYSLFYPPKTMYCWVTHSEWRGDVRYSLKYRFHSSFMGALGLGANLNNYDEKQTEQARELVAQYKRIRPLIQHGTLHRLTPLGYTDQLAVQYIAADQRSAVVLAFRNSAPPYRQRLAVRLKDLLPGVTYHLSGDLPAESPKTISGAALMALPLRPELTGNFASACIEIAAAPPSAGSASQSS